MSDMDSIGPARLGGVTIYAGSVFRKSLQRVTYPYPLMAGWPPRKLDGSPAPDDDRQVASYIGATALMELRDKTSDALLHTFTSADGSIICMADRLMLYLTAAQTKALSPFGEATGHVEVRQPWGDIERQYEIGFVFSAESTLAEPPALP